MNYRVEELIKSIRHLKDNNETPESLRTKNNEQIAIQLNLHGIENVNDEFIDSVKKAFDILFNPS